MKRTLSILLIGAALVGLGRPCAATLINLDLYNSEPLLNSDAATPLLGNTSAGDLIQVILLGAGNTVSTPDSFGNPSGNNTLLSFGNPTNSWLHVGYGLPGNADQGWLDVFPLQYDSSLVGTGIVVRFWNGTTPGGATYYGNSSVFYLPNGTGPNADQAYLDFAPSSSYPHVTDQAFGALVIPEPSNLLLFGMMFWGVREWRRRTRSVEPSGNRTKINARGFNNTNSTVFDFSVAGLKATMAINPARPPRPDALISNSVLIPPCIRVAFLTVKLCSTFALRWGVAAGIAFTLTQCVLGQDNVAAKTGEELFNDGVALISKAEKSEKLAEKISDLRLAIEQFRASAAREPDRKRVNATWARALDHLVRLTSDSNRFDRQERLQWVREASQRYLVAGESAGPDWEFYDEWGLFLTYCAETAAADQSEQRANLLQARAAFEKALEFCDLPLSRASLESHLGTCLLRLAAVQTKTEERRRLYQLATEKFQSASEKSEATLNGKMLSDWGEAQLELGKIDNDPSLLSQALEHFQSSASQQPRNLDTQYKLLSAFALVDRHDSAAGELHIAPERSPAKIAESPFTALRENAPPKGATGSQAAPVIPDSIPQLETNPQKQAGTIDASTSAAYSKHAAEQYERAATAKPGDYGAQLMWANYLSKLSQTATNATERQSLAKSARDRFAVAAHCAGADWRVYYNWAALLTSRVETFAKSPSDAIAVLTEASELFARSLTRAPFSGDKALVEHDSGMCLVLLAERTPNARDRRSLYVKAISQIGAAADRSPKLMTGHSFGLWGVALLQVAKLDNNRMMMRQATERLLSALEIDANNAEARYNLVCAYALLDQPENAMRHLRICLDSDPNRTYYTAAASDPDLWTLRRTAEYNSIFSPAANSLPEPRLSDR